MYVLDTNVLSEVMKANPAEPVVRWLETRAPASVFTTTICAAEIFYGVRRLPEGRRRRALEAAIDRLFARVLAGRILPFDEMAASLYADLRLDRERAGAPVTREDGMIAAIARAAGAVVVTRDVKGFLDCGVDLIDPFDGP